MERAARNYAFGASWPFDRRVIPASGLHYRLPSSVVVQAGA
ncbi:MAG: hypothetical protein Q4A17_12570 [Thermoguttaceae bacterium]|nr:hypothetical protein [Thermoguttaceae bacterium]